jgi:hypothetical protein
MSVEAQAVGGAGVAVASAALQFSDAASFRTWLEGLPHGDTVQCHSDFAAQVKELARAPLSPSTRLQLLELMRETVADIQRGYGEVCWGRPVPLGAGDRTIWNQVVSVWRDMAAAYDSLIVDMANGAEDIAARAHIICQRALRYTGLAISEYNRVYHAVSGDLWRQLHRLYVFSENAGVATTGVLDPVGRSDPTTTCAATYLHTLLAQLAQPDALTLQQMTLLDRWLDRWERLAALSADPLPDSAIPPLAVDLGSGKGVGFARDLATSGLGQDAPRSCRVPAAGQNTGGRRPWRRAAHAMRKLSAVALHPVVRGRHGTHGSARAVRAQGHDLSQHPVDSFSCHRPGARA